MDSQVSADGAEAGVNFPLTFYQTVDDLMSSGATTEVLMMLESSAEDGQVELVNGITAAILSQGGVLLLNESEAVSAQQLPGGQDLVAADVLQAPESREVVDYFEMIPNVFPSEASTQFTLPPDTVLSSALSSKPIPSTLPIVSKHAPPLALTLERLEEDEGDGVSDPDETEQEDPQLEEHW